MGGPGFNPWVGKIPWRRERLPSPVFWPGEFHGLYSPWSRKESDTTERLSLHFTTNLLLKMNTLQKRFPISSFINFPFLLSVQAKKQTPFWIRNGFSIINNTAPMVIVVMLQQCWANTPQSSSSPKHCSWPAEGIHFFVQISSFT